MYIFSKPYRNQLRYLRAKIAVKRYGGRVASATSQLINVTLLFGKRPNESISGRAYRMSNEGIHIWNYTRIVLDFIFRTLFRQQEHCKVAYMSDVVESNMLIIEHERATEGD